MYYEINETAARRAKQMNSFYDYKPGSATAEYRSMVDKATDIAERQKARVDPMHHQKIDRYLDLYARKLAVNMNHSFEIDARVPSVMIAGPANFPVRKKEKQNAARDKNMNEWRYIQGLLDKIRSIGMGGISSDDPQVLEKLEQKLSVLESEQADMKRINAYYRKHKSLAGCEGVSDDAARKLDADMQRFHHSQPYPGWTLSNNNANIKRVRERIESLKAAKENPITGWDFPGGHVVANQEANRLQIFFEDKPGEELRKAMKDRGFRWAPKWDGRPWQRQLTKDAVYAAKHFLPGEVEED